MDRGEERWAGGWLGGWRGGLLTTPLGPRNQPNLIVLAVRELGNERPPAVALAGGLASFFVSYLNGWVGGWVGG